MKKETSNSAVSALLILTLSVDTSILAVCIQTARACSFGQEIELMINTLSSHNTDTNIIIEQNLV